MDRRRYLKSVGSVAMVALAGCGETSTSLPEIGTSPTSSPEPAPTTTDEPGGPGTPTATATPSPTATPPPDVAAEVSVGAGGGLQFDPESVTVAVGDVVRWVWKSGGHNVKPGDIPADADWSGTPGGENETFESGVVYSVPFEVAGTYEYYCAPHRSAGMTGSVIVE